MFIRIIVVNVLHPSLWNGELPLAESSAFKIILSQININVHYTNININVHYTNININAHYTNPKH